MGIDLELAPAPILERRSDAGVQADQIEVPRDLG